MVGCIRLLHKHQTEISIRNYFNLCLDIASPAVLTKRLTNIALLPDNLVYRRSFLLQRKNPFRASSLIGFSHFSWYGLRGCDTSNLRTSGASEALSYIYSRQCSDIYSRQCSDP